MDPSLLPPALVALQRHQDGVVSRHQALAHGLAAHDVRRMLRRREWVPLQPGVYVDHTGVPTWQQRAWAAVLVVWPAALFGDSALRAYDGPGHRERADRPGTVIEVAIDRTRSVPAPVPGVRVRHVSGLADAARWNLAPPRQRYADAALEVAIAARDDLDRVAALARACGTRRTTAEQLPEALASRGRVRGRRWLVGVLDDVAQGTCSVLEQAYLTRVERAHGLPRAERQRREHALTGVVYRDAAYGRAVVELDGRLHHTSPERRDADLERDLDLAATGGATVRLGWGQVYGRSCTTSLKVAAFLRACGVAATASPCGPGCAVRGEQAA